MANSKTEGQRKINYPTKKKTKFVKKANAYVTTSFEPVKGGYKQVQDWSVERPE